MKHDSAAYQFIQFSDPVVTPAARLIGESRIVPITNPTDVRAGDLNLHTNIFGFPTGWSPRRIAGLVCVGLVGITVALMVAFIFVQLQPGFAL